jgi:hypothetical protein
VTRGPSAPARPAIGTSRDLEATQDFYGAVLGWKCRNARLSDRFPTAPTDGVPVAEDRGDGHGMADGRGLEPRVTSCPFRRPDRQGMQPPGSFFLGERRGAVGRGRGAARTDVRERYFTRTAQCRVRCTEQDAASAQGSSGKAKGRAACFAGALPDGHLRFRSAPPCGHPGDDGRTAGPNGASHPE